jgi:hypothetical protein
MPQVSSEQASASSSPASDALPAISRRSAVHPDECDGRVGRVGVRRAEDTEQQAEDAGAADRKPADGRRSAGTARTHERDEAPGVDGAHEQTVTPAAAPASGGVQGQS